VTVSEMQTDADCIDDYLPSGIGMGMPDTMINFNAPVVINIHNGDNCDGGCSENEQEEPVDPVDPVDPIECNFDDFDDDDKIQGFVDYIYSSECYQVMDMRRDHPTDEELKA